MVRIKLGTSVRVSGFFESTLLYDSHSFNFPFSAQAQTPWEEISTWENLWVDCLLKPLEACMHMTFYVPLYHRTLENMV